MKVLLVGGRGFVGRNLIEFLPDHLEVFVSSRYSQMADFILNIDNVEDFDFSFFDVVINLAAIVHNIDDTISWLDYKQANYLFPKLIFQRCVEHNVKHFIHISTVNLYNSELIDMSSTIHVKTKYEKSKLLLDQFLLNNNHNIPYTIIRCPLIYGRFNKGNLATLKKIIDIGLPLPFKSFNNYRSYLSVINLAGFINHCLLNTYSYNNVFLLSDDDDITTSQFLEFFIKTYSSRSYLFYFPLSLLKILFFLIGKAHTFNLLTKPLVVDISFTKTHLYWQSILTFRESISKFKN